MADQAQTTRQATAPAGFSSLQNALARNLPAALSQAHKLNRAALAAVSRRTRIGGRHG